MAQENYTRFERISSAEGFSQSVVNSIVQDSRGFMWFGTQGGLYRYDGYKFTVFRYDPKDYSSLPVNKVLVIYEDRSNNLWIGTEGGGLNRFNRSSENFTRYVYNNPTDPNPDLDINNVRAIIEDRHRILWVGTFGGGLLSFDPQRKKWRRFKSGLEYPWSLNNNLVRTLCEDSNGLLWIGTHGGGVNVLDPINNTFSHYTHVADEKQSLCNNNVRAIIQDKDGAMWIGTDSGLDRFDSSSRQFIHYQNQPGKPDSLVGDGVRSLFYDKENILWVGTITGLDRLKSREEGTFIHYRNEPDKPYSLSHNVVISIYEDRAGSIWIGTNGGGMNRLDRQKQQFGHYLGNPNDPGSLSSNEIVSILQDKKGELWVGTYNKGLNRYDASSGKFIHYQTNPKNPNSLSSDDVVAIYQDKVGDLWIGTWGKGLNQLIRDQKNETIIRYHNDKTNTSGPGSDQIFCFSEDQDGNLWVGTYGGGLNRFVREKKEFVYYKNDALNPRSISSNNITAIFPDHNKKSILWLGTYNNGLDCFDRETGIFYHYTNQPDTASLSYNAVRTIYISRNHPDVLWIGTFGGGLNRFDQQKKTWRVYTEVDGLSDNTIYGILEDGTGELWMSTNRGLSRFNPRDGTFINYDANDGLQGNEFSQGAFHKGLNGQFYFGGVNGYNVFYPEKITRNPYLPPVVITAFKIFNSNAPLNQSILETKEIRLSYRDSVFSFEFAALNYIGTAKNQYAYKIEADEDRWIQLNDKREITFSRLSPGMHKFQVKGSNNDGLWNNQVASIKLIIEPPFWLTWWFRILAIIAMMAGILLLYKLRVRTYKRQREKLRIEVLERTREIREQSTIIEDKNKLLEISYQGLKKSEEDLLELNATKDKFFSIISHDLRNLMTALLGPADLLANSYEALTEDQKRSYNKNIDKSVNQLNDLLMNLLHWARSQTGKLACKPRKIDLNEIVSDTITIHRLTAKKKAIEISADLPENITAYADKDMATFIIRNLISNSIKFTGPDGMIRLTAEVKDDWIEVAVIDNGVGISEEAAMFLFKVGMTHTSKGTANEKGNGLGLVLCKEFAEKNGGRIWFERPDTGDGKGSIFRFTLPKAEKKGVQRRLG